jgi:hypothetical protein
VQAAHPCTVSARYGAGLASARLVDELSSLMAVAGCRRSLADRRPEPLTAASRSASGPSFWPAPACGSAGGAGKTLTVRRCGQSLSGRKSIWSNGWSIRRSPRTRYNFLYASSRPALRAAATTQQLAATAEL